MESTNVAALSGDDGPSLRCAAACFIFARRARFSASACFFRCISARRSASDDFELIAGEAACENGKRCPNLNKLEKKAIFLIEIYYYVPQ